MKPFVAIAILVAVSLRASSAAPTQQRVAAGSSPNLGSSSLASLSPLNGNAFGSALDGGFLGGNSDFGLPQGSLGSGTYQQSYNHPSFSFFLPNYGSLSYTPGAAGSQWFLNGNSYNGVYNGGYGGGYSGGYGGGYGTGYGNGNVFPFGYGSYGIPGSYWQAPTGFGYYSNYNQGFRDLQGQVSVGQVPAALGLSRSSLSSGSRSSRSGSA